MDDWGVPQTGLTNTKGCIQVLPRGLNSRRTCTRNGTLWPRAAAIAVKLGDVRCGDDHELKYLLSGDDQQ